MKRRMQLAIKTEKRRFGRAGLSRVDVFVLIAVLLVIAANCLPTLARLREIARRKQCAGNLRALGTALHAYHDVYHSLPPAAFWEDAQMIIDSDLRPARNADSVRATNVNWVQLVLPYLGRTDLASTFSAGVSVTDEANRRGRTTLLPDMTCPTDDFNVATNPFVLTTSDRRSFEFARGNYAINGGSHGNAEWPGRMSYPISDGNIIVFRSAQNDFMWWGNGVAGFNKCFSFADFSNGLASTVAVDEIRAGIVREDPRGAWALGQIGSSVTWAHGVSSDDYGPNNQLPDSDDILGGQAIAEKYGTTRFHDAQMPFCAHCTYSNQATARSSHPGGVNIMMADSSARFVSNEIEPGLWHVLHSRETPADVLSGSIEAADLESQKKPNAEQRGPSQPSAASTSDLAVNSPKRILNSIGINLVLIPSGTFVMGLPDKGNTYQYPSDDAPAHDVRITSPFYLGTTEVTQRQFHTVTGTDPSWHSKTGGGAALVRSLDTARLPVENVTWREAAAFCKSLSDLPAEKGAGRVYRLPTEAEWEYACRSGSSEPHPFVSDWTGADNFDELAGKDKHPTKEPLFPRPVGSYKPNAFGVYDMRGNVFEWTGDWFDRTYYRRSPRNDPQGPPRGFMKVVRGWDWVFIGPQCKEFTTMMPPWKKNPYIGFRVACDVKSTNGP
jgi:formylglycine-generating enzyme required for sulfatase activity